MTHCSTALSVLSDSVVGSRISSQSLMITVQLHTQSVYINSGDYDCYGSADDETMEISQTMYGV